MVYIIEDFKILLRYSDDTLNINNIYFDNMVSEIYPAEIHRIKPIPLILKSRFWTCN